MVRSFRPGLVQSEAQYQFIYTAINHYVQTICSRISAEKVSTIKNNKILTLSDYLSGIFFSLFIKFLCLENWDFWTRISEYKVYRRISNNCRWRKCANSKSLHSTQSFKKCHYMQHLSYYWFSVSVSNPRQIKCCWTSWLWPWKATEYAINNPGYYRFVS